MGGGFLKAAIAVWVAAAFAATASAAPGVPHPDALTLPAPGGGGVLGPSLMRTLLLPGRPDWYVLAGGAARYTEVTIDAVDVPAGCVSQRVRVEDPYSATVQIVDKPFGVSLYNPEGHWIRAIGPYSARTRPSSGPDVNVYSLHARYPGRYLVQIGISDPRCGGLRYRMQATYAGCGPTGRCVMGVEKYVATASQCNSLKAQRTRAARLLATAHHPSRKDLRRLTGDLQQKTMALASHPECGSHA